MINNRVFAIVALLLAVGLFFGYINPTWLGSIAETKAAIESTDVALTAAGTYAKREADLLLERNAIDESNLKRLELMVPSSVDNVALILSIYGLAARSGFVLSSIDIAKDTPAAQSSTPGLGSASVAGPTSSIDLTLAGTGNYKAFMAFIEGLERSQRILDVRNVRVTSAPTGVYSYQMSVRFYWLR